MAESEGPTLSEPTASTAPTEAPPAPTGSTRTDLIRAGRRLADELPLERLYAGVTTAAVARAAGVTTGSFFHHFPSALHFADALVRSFVDDATDVAAGVDELLDGLGHDDLTAILSERLTGTWLSYSRDEQIRADFRGQMHLLAHHAVPLVEPTDDLVVVGDVLRANARTVIGATAAGWARMLAITGMRPVEGFDEVRLATVTQALMTGLQALHAVDPAAVDDRLFSDVSTALATAFTRTDLRHPRVLLTGRLGQDRSDTQASPQARAGARRSDETRRRIVEAAAGLFDHGWDHLSATDIAEASGVSTQTVINLFGGVRRVCAASFVRHLPAFEAAIEASMPDRPMEALRTALLHLARAAAEDPHPARALLVERLGIRASRDFDLADDDIRLLAPFGIRLTYVVAQLSGKDLAEPEVPDLAALLTDTVLVHAIPRPHHAEESVRLALRLLPPELVEPADRPESGT